MSKFSPLSLRSPLDELARALNSFGRHHSIDQVFFDWVEMCALAISNSVDRAQYDAREATYMAIVGRYSKDEARLLAEMHALLVLQLERGLSSPFNELMAKLELGSAGARKRMGAYFTPWNVSYMMAKISLAPTDKLSDRIKENGFITMAEPACGAGGMVLSFAQAMQDEGLNFQKQLHVMAQDINRDCVHMTYVQASLVGIPAVVMQGNTLGREPPTAHWFTPFHILFGWNRRLTERTAHELPAQKPPVELAAQQPAHDGPELAASNEAFTEEPAAPLPDKPITPLGISKWKIHWDDAGPTLSLP